MNIIYNNSNLCTSSTNTTIPSFCTKDSETQPAEHSEIPPAEDSETQHAEHSETTREETKQSNNCTNTVTTELYQLGSGQDAKPAYLENAEFIAMSVGDGHGGSDTANILSNPYHSSEILNEMIKHGPVNAMYLAQQKCKDCKDGAMFILALYNKKTRLLQVISVGDASCSVYQQNEMIFEQPHHDSINFIEKYGYSTLGVDLEGNEYGDLNIDTGSGKQPTLTPQPDGKTMCIPKHEPYFLFDDVYDTQRIAGSSFVGHKDLPRLPAFLNELTIRKGPFHLIMTSDGVSDMINPKDAIMRDANVNAQKVTSEAKKRWSTPFFDAIDGYKDKKDPTKMINIGGPIKRKYVDGKFVDYCKGGDDISVLVLNVQYD